MCPTYRSGQQGDVPACIGIIRDWSDETSWLDELDDDASLQAFWSELFRTDLVWVAEASGRVVGFCTRDGDNIGALYVTGDARCSGIGKRLLDLAKADREWITVWAYALNTRALQFYHREGLVEISREVEEHSGLLNVEHRWKRPG